MRNKTNRPKQGVSVMVEPPAKALPPVVPYDSREEIEDSQYQVVWSKVMSKGRYPCSGLYKKIEVLMLRWADKYDNLSISGEFDRLKDVFKTHFNYNVTVELLEKGAQLQVTLNLIIAKWAKEHNTSETLLVVYYAGHGKPGVVPGELRFQGHTSPNDEAQKEDDFVIWNQTEAILKAAKLPDVLQIFDCCYAGYLALTRDASRSFEYIAATEHDERTAVPGKDSFTSALIWALERLREEKSEGRFTTDQLLAKIKNEAPDFPKQQHPMLVRREHKSRPGRIMLHPLYDDNADRGSREPNGPGEEAKKKILTFHFELSEKMDIISFELFGYRINEIFEQNPFGVNRVRYGGQKSSKFAFAVEQFKNTRERRRVSLAAAQLPDDNPMPLTPISAKVHKVFEDAEKGDHGDLGILTPDELVEKFGEAGKCRKRSRSAGEEACQKDPGPPTSRQRRTRAMTRRRGTSS